MLCRVHSKLSEKAGIKTSSFISRENWLNDVHINIILRQLSRHRNSQSEHIHFFHSYDLEKLADKSWASRPARVSVIVCNCSQGGDTCEKCEVLTKGQAYWKSQSSKPWVPLNPKFLVIPCNVQHSHWFLAFVDRGRRQVHYFNSLKHVPKDMQSFIKPALGAVFKDIAENEWTHLLFGDMPQQSNDEDCGVWVCAVALSIYALLEQQQDVFCGICKLTCKNIEHLRTHMWQMLSTRLSLQKYLMLGHCTEAHVSIQNFTKISHVSITWTH